MGPRLLTENNPVGQRAQVQASLLSESKTEEMEADNCCSSLISSDQAGTRVHLKSKLHNPFTRLKVSEITTFFFVPERIMLGI
ncbi:hypothetical protein Hanom_Chr05g00402271 [Helianthus anomalus]